MSTENSYETIESTLRVPDAWVGRDARGEYLIVPDEYVKPSATPFRPAKVVLGEKEYAPSLYRNEAGEWLPMYADIYDGVVHVHGSTKNYGDHIGGLYDLLSDIATEGRLVVQVVPEDCPDGVHRVVIEPGSVEAVYPTITWGRPVVVVIRNHTDHTEYAARVGDVAWASGDVNIRTFADEESFRDAFPDAPPFEAGAAYWEWRRE